MKDVSLTAEIARRPSHPPPDCEAESRAPAALARVMADAPRTILKRFVAAAMEVTGADTAGISRPDDHRGAPALRWHAIAGTYAEHLTEIAPRDDSPLWRCRRPRGHPTVRRPRSALRLHRRGGSRIAEALLIPNKVPVRHTCGCSPTAIARSSTRKTRRVIADIGEFCAAALHVLYSRDGKATEHLHANAVFGELAAREGSGRQARSARGKGIGRGADVLANATPRCTVIAPPG